MKTAVDRVAPERVKWAKNPGPSTAINREGKHESPMAVGGC